MDTQTRFGIAEVSAIFPSGLGYLQMEGDQRTRPFVVGKMLPGYNGAAYETFGLGAGARVFATMINGGVDKIVPFDSKAPVKAVEEMSKLLEVRCQLPDIASEHAVVEFMHFAREHSRARMPAEVETRTPVNA